MIMCGKVRIFAIKPLKVVNNGFGSMKKSDGKMDWGMCRC